MATSGYFQTNEYHGSKHKGLQFNWSRTGYDISGNYSDIYWEWVGFGSDSGYHELHNSKLWIAGENVYSQKSGTSIRLYSGTVVASGTKRIYHDNDGTKSFSAYGEGGVYTNAVNCTGEGTWALDTIPRYANITSFSVSKRDETSVQFNYSVDASCDWAWYSTDNGANWSNLPSNNIVSGLSANTGYNFKLRVRRTDSQLTTDSGTYWQSTYDYPHVTSTPNFNIGDAMYMDLYNPLGRTVTATMYGDDDSVIWTGTGWTGNRIGSNNAPSDIDNLYKSIPNKNSGTYKMRIVYSNVSNRYTVGGTYYTKVSECSPTFTNFNYQDSNSSVTSVTGNNQVLVKGLSTLQVIIPSANKMTTQKYATPSSYSTSCDNRNGNANYSTQDVTINLGTISNSGSKRLNVTAYDSRGNSASAYKDITVYDYAKPVINISASRLNNFENETTLKVEGTYTKLTINNTDKNTITGVQYRYRETGGTWGGWTNINTTVSNGTFTCNDVILSLDNSKSFEFEVKVTDNLQTNTVSTSIDIGQAIFFISTNNRACYINGQEILQYDVVDTW